MKVIQLISHQGLDYFELHRSLRLIGSHLFLVFEFLRKECLDFISLEQLNRASYS